MKIEMITVLCFITAIWILSISPAAAGSTPVTPEPELPLHCSRFQIRDCRPPVGKFMWYTRIKNISSESQSFRFRVVLKDEKGNELTRFDSNIFELKPGDNYILRSRKQIEIPERIYREWRISEVYLSGYSRPLGSFPKAPEGDIIDFGP